MHKKSYCDLRKQLTELNFAYVRG